jgi:hypothetical protein
VSWLFATAPWLAADIVLFGEAARVQGAQVHQPRLDGSDAFFALLDLLQNSVLFHIR